MKNIAIILARSGSKGLKDKNIRLLNGKPLVAYSIEAALHSDCFDTVHVSTDSYEYARIAEEYGAEVPFLRSDKNSSDSANSWEAVKEVLHEYEKTGKNFDRIMLLQPTSPLRTKEDIINAFKLYETKDARAIVSVCEMEHSPKICNTLPDDLEMVEFVKNSKDTRRQALGVYYRINGAMYLVDTEFLLESTYLYRSGCYAYIMDKRKSLDIDDLFDFEMAEYFIQRINDINEG